jgi:hypothetical protein
MSYLNKETGLYEAHYLMKRDNTMLVGTGSTKQAASDDLKAKKTIYYSTKMEPIVRKTSITFARKDLADFMNDRLQKGEKC